MTKKPKRPRRSRKQTKKPFIVPWQVIEQRIDNLDPFEISPHLIPEGSSYQWCSWVVMGEPDEYMRDKWLRDGWKHVPASRHPGAPQDKKGHIYLQGQMLMERPLKLTLAAQAEEYTKATAQIDGERKRTGQDKAPKERVYAPATTSDYTPPDRPLEPTVVEVPIKIVLTTREVEVAIACKMTNERYAQNKLTLLTERKFDPTACAALVPSKNGTFAFSGISFVVVPE